MANHLDIMRGVYGMAFSAALDFMAIDTCSIYGERTVKNEFGKISSEGYSVAKDYPCAISFGTSIQSTGAPLPEASQDITLFLDLGVKIEPGMMITVKQGMSGRIENYNMAGVPKVYDTHQEIMLERTDKKIGVTSYEPDRLQGSKPVSGEDAENGE